MYLVGLMVVRNEEWVLAASLVHALSWCDAVVVLDHASTDGTQAIVRLERTRHGPQRVILLEEPDGSRWDEMDHRQRTLDAGRLAGGTHFAIIDADEILTANLVGGIRPYIEAMSPGDNINLPMIPCWRSLAEYRNDRSIWSRTQLTAVFRDAPSVHWVADRGYQHHRRLPYGTSGVTTSPFKREVGGVMHLQFANWERLVAKHAWYKMIETLRWPGRRSVAEFNKMYGHALDERGIRLSRCQDAWWEPTIMRLIHPHGGEPWQAAECRRMWAEHGPEKFTGLELWGVPQGS